MNRYAMSIIEMPLEIYPDGTYKQLTERARVRFELLARLPEIHELPKTVPLAEVLASVPTEPEKEIRIRTVIPEESPVITQHVSENKEIEQQVSTPEPDEPECGFITMEEIQAAPPKRPSNSRTFKTHSAFGSRFSRRIT